MLWAEYNKALKLKKQKEIFDNCEILNQYHKTLARKNSERRIGDRLRVFKKLTQATSPYVNGKRNDNFSNPSLKSQVFESNKLSKSYIQLPEKAKIPKTESKTRQASPTRSPISYIDYLEDSNKKKDELRTKFTASTFKLHEDVDKREHRIKSARKRYETNEKFIQTQKLPVMKTNEKKEVFYNYNKDYKKVDRGKYRDELCRQIQEKGLKREQEKSREKEINETYVRNNNEEYKIYQERSKDKKDQIRNTFINDNKYLMQVKQQKRLYETNRTAVENENFRKKYTM